MINYINYLVTIVGLGMILISLFLITADKIRGERIFYDLSVKEQEIKKVIEEADEMIGELVYTSEAVVNQVEYCINNKKQQSINSDNKTNNFIEVEDEVKPADKNSQATIRTKKEKEVLECVNKGMNVDEIAKKLHIGKGEVALILTLNSGVERNEII